LVESLLIALTGGAFGIILAVGGTIALKAADPGRLPRAGEIRLDASVLAFALAVSIATAVALAMLSAWRATRGDVREALSESERAMSGAGSSSNTRRALVVAQVAMTIVLLVAAGLLARSFVRLLEVDPGFRTERTTVLDIAITADDSVARNARTALYHELLARLATTPGVEAVGAVNVIPLDPVGKSNGMFLELSSAAEAASVDFRRLTRDDPRAGYSDFRVASGGYFAAMRIPLLEGRVFDERDMPTAPHVAIISKSLAAQRWPGQDPIGKWIEYGGMDGDIRPFQIVGIVGDVREDNLSVQPRPVFYANYLQRSVMTARMNVVIAGQVDPATPRAIVRALRPDIPPRIRTMRSIVSASVGDQRFILFLVGVFGGAALLLAALGVYSVISYLVAQRERELTIRVALGARAADILGLVLRQGAILAVAGIVIGSLVALAGTRLLASLLFGVSSTDPVAFVGVALLVAIVALAACFLPARRASRMALVALFVFGARAHGQSVTIYRHGSTTTTRQYSTSRNSATRCPASLCRASTATMARCLPFTRQMSPASTEDMACMAARMSVSSSSVRSRMAFRTYLWRERRSPQLRLHRPVTDVRQR
jgi:predicted permease